MTDQTKDQHRDYVNGDEKDNLAAILPTVYDWLQFDHIYTTNFRHSWVVDPMHGIEEIIWSTASVCDGDYETQIMGHFRDKSHLDYPAARGFAHTVYAAVTTLIESGLLELTIDWGWPALRLTVTAINDTHHWGPGVAADRAAAMRERIAHLRSMPYEEYLQSDEWRYRREQHIEAAGFRCQLCNSDERPLHVHHRTYANRGREKFFDLVALCGICHQNFHNSGRKVR